ncbi:MAG: DUF3267 domain-containing protein [Verrucomicrobiae bacterium]|nr:DUF3267 domain-containing protein [Verrucomicrobiae bacterium]
MFIPGFLVTWATFPGVIVHEFAHKLFCQITGTRVIEVRYFQFDNPAGYVLHEIPTSPWKHLLIGFGPLIVNTLGGLGIALAALPLKGVGEGTNPLFVVLMWLAISVAMHSFPSTGDAKSIWEGIWGERGSILSRIVGTPLVGIIFLGALVVCQD